MANIASVLKTEITRIARKEVRAEIENLKKANSQHRGHIAELRREIAALQKQLRQVSRERAAVADETKALDRKYRFSAIRLAAHRAKLGLSAADYGKLAEVSGSTVYLWEQKKSRPKPEQVQRLGMLKGVSRKAALAQLEQIKGNAASSSN
jgi:DNA-binding transcriptional regulator YiaG